jgi:hypothetical protein
MDIYMALDKNQHVPLLVTWHFLTCKTCRRNVSLLKKIETFSSEQYKGPVSYSEKTLALIMKQIDPSFVAEEKNTMPHVSMTKWIISGLFIVVAMIFFGVFAIPESRQGMYAVATSIFAIVFTLYCGFFVASNLDYFIKQIETHSLISKGSLG